MPTESKELIKIIAALSQLIGEMFEYLPFEDREIYKTKYFDIMGDKDRP